GIERSIATFAASHFFFSRNLKSRTSKPPPEFPTRYSSPFSGGFPLPACAHVEEIRSAVHRKSPSAGIFPYSPSGHTWNPCRRHCRFFSVISCSVLSVTVNFCKRLLFQVSLKHRAPHFPAQPPHFPQSHRAQHFQQLVAPRSQQVLHPLHSPALVHLARHLEAARPPVRAFPHKLPLHRHQRRRIQHH